MKEGKLRHELKYFITYSDYLAIRTRLRAIAKPDANASPSGNYFIRSLYFDNFYDKALREKIDGVNIREKFRIRYYNNDCSYIILEKKSKIHGLCKKQQTVITKDQCQSIIDGDYSALNHSSDSLLKELYVKMNTQQMRPKVIVDYIREPYIYEFGNVRVTLDSNIRTGIYNKDFLNENVPTIYTNAGTIILEVKYDEFLPEIIQQAVQIGTTSQTAFSKYAACRMYG